jgi:hypothetical protein
MDTLHDRLEDLSEDAPTGGAPPAELWARGKRVHRFRTAAIAATCVVVAAVGAGVGLRLIDGHHSDPPAAKAVRLALPIDYPVGRELPDLGDTPGRLAAIWLVPEVGGGDPQAVGLVARTGRFGTLPIHVWSTLYLEDPYAYFALSPDGGRIAYHTPAKELVVRDLVSGESYSPAFESFQSRPGYTWVDATHLVGHVQPEEADPASPHQGGEADGWVWEPGTEPKLVDLMKYPGSPYLSAHAGIDPWFLDRTGSRTCSAPTFRTARPTLCDLLGVIGSRIVLTHWNSEVVALDRADSPWDDPTERHVVVTAGAPERVTFATDVIEASLGGAS